MNTPALDLTGEGVAARLRAAGLRPHLVTPTLLLSLPRSGAVTIAARGDIEARPAPFSRSTGDRAVEGRIADPSRDERGALDGSVALVDEPLTPDLVFSLERRGASAQIFIEGRPGERPRSCSTIWGTPTHESIGRQPRTPVVVVSRRDGEVLREAANVAARVRVSATLDEGWFAAAIAVVTIRGAFDPDEFILVHGSADDILLALAEDLHARRGELARSVRIAWWPDRALGTAVGSTWYPDAFAGELDEWCVAHVSVGGTESGDAWWMAEAAELCLASSEAAGHPAPSGRRPPREADYSFNQIGITGLFGGRLLPRAVYSEAVWRTATSPIYPFDYTAAVLEMGAAIQRYQAAAGVELDLGDISQQLSRLRRAIAAWRSDAEAALARHPADAALRRQANGTLRRLARGLVPLGYARGERLDHDPAIGYSAVPRLEAALHVAATSEPMRSFVKTALVRERNKIAAAIQDALRLLDPVRPVRAADMNRV